MLPCDSGAYFDQSGHFCRSHFEPLWRNPCHALFYVPSVLCPLCGALPFRTIRAALRRKTNRGPLSRSAARTTVHGLGRTSGNKR